MSKLTERREDPAVRGQTVAAKVETLDCRTCGFRGESLGPADAIVAIRSLPRRFRSLLLQARPRHERSAARVRPEGGWSAVEHAAHVRDALHVVEKRVMRLLAEDTPALPSLDLSEPPPGANEQVAEIVLATLLVNAEALARTLAGVHGAAWRRAGLIEGDSETVLDLTRQAVHIGVHHLRLAERAIEAGRAGRAV